MRIIAGSCKGRPILAPKGMDTRPTLDRVKESLFGIIQFQIYGKTVLDLFAGSGNLGLEALSRGASFAAFNDMSRDAVKVIRANIEKLGFEQKSVVMNVDFAQAIRSLSARRFDIVFLDPPYRAGLMEKALKELSTAGILNDGAMVLRRWIRGRLCFMTGEYTATPRCPFTGWKEKNEKRCFSGKLRSVYGWAS